MVFLHRYFQTGNISTLPSQSRTGLFSDSHCKNLAELLEVKLTGECGLGLSGVFDSPASPQPASSKSSIPVGVFLFWHWFQGQHPPWQVLTLHLGACLFNFGVSGVPAHLTPLKGLRRVDVSVGSAFYLLL